MEKVAKLSKLKEKNCIKIKGKELALFKIGNKLYCTDNLCTHAQGQLCEGNLQGTLIECPWHNSKFDVISGKVKNPPARENLKTYKITIKEDDVYINI